MHKIKELLREANSACSKADYLAYMTYPLVNEVKLLGVIIESVHVALTKTMDALLSYDRLYKRISTPKGDFKQELRIFQDHCSRRYNIDRSFSLLINDIHHIVTSKKASPMEFVRNNKYVICSSDYKMKALTLQKVKEHLEGTKKLIKKANAVLRI